MHATRLACAVLGTAASVFAQCSGGPPAATLSTRSEFLGSFYYGPAVPGTAPLVDLFDLNVGAAVQISSINTWMYDQGIGNPVVPNQVGNTATVKLWTCATTWTGNQNQNPNTTPAGTPWTLAATGTMVVQAEPTESVINFATPASIAAGTYGVAIEFLATTSGTNPGSLHTLGVSPNTLLTASDQFLTVSNQGIEQTAWAGGVNTNTGLNLRIHYTAGATAAYSTSFGAGCYFHPQAFYQNFPESPSAPSLANTGFQMVPLNPNQYVVVPVSPNIQPHSTPSLTLQTPTGTSSGCPLGCWDDSYMVETLPFTFPFPTGSTNAISVGSNGYIFLGAETSTSFTVCGACYGSIAVFRDNKPRIAPYFHDLDATTQGGIFYEVDPSPTPSFVRITWDAVPEWGVATALNTMQIELDSNGTVTVYYGALSNTSATNNAIAGFTPGLGALLPAAQNLVATMPFQTGDGSIPPILSLSVRPVTGTTTQLVTTNITPGTFFVFQVMGFGTIPAGNPLAFIGMPGCFQYVVPATSLLLPVIGGQSSANLTIPNVASFAGTIVSGQSAPLTPGLNAAGILTSNGMCMKVGTF